MGSNPERRLRIVIAFVAVSDWFVIGGIMQILRRRVTRSIVAAIAVIMLVSGSVVGLASPAGAAPSWSIVPSPSRPAELNELEDVSCVRATYCFAVGSSIDDAGDSKTLVERWDGTRWSIVPSPSPNSGPGSGLRGISCASVIFCIAVGGANHMPLVERWDGARWNIVATPNPSAGAAFLVAVSCTSATSCIAVGDSSTSADRYQTLVERWDGTHWSIVASPNPAGSNFNFLESVSCTTATNCVAVGSAGDGIHPVPVVQRWNGTRMASETVPGDGILRAVSCTSATSCLAVGSEHSPPFKGLTARWDGTRWSAVPGPGPLISGLSCASANDCTAVGGTHFQPQPRSFMEHWDGNGWSAMPSPDPPDIDFLRAVSCAGTTFCVAVGTHYQRPGFGTATLVEHYSVAPTRPPIVGVAATPSGHGYWLVGSDGGVFTFGSARFFGSTGGMHLNQPIVGMAATPTGHGYWLVASDGGIFTNGSAHYYGSTGGDDLNHPIVGMATGSTAPHYLLVASNGGAFEF